MTPLYGTKRSEQFISFMFAEDAGECKFEEFYLLCQALSCFIQIVSIENYLSYQGNTLLWYSVAIFFCSGGGGSWVWSLSEPDRNVRSVDWNFGKRISI